MTIKDYINDNIDTINGFKQDKLPRTDRGKSELEDAKKHPWFAKAVEKLSIPMSRDEVREYYNKDLYLGFLATLIWGGAHLNYRENFRKMVGTHPDEIVFKLQRILELLKKGNTAGGEWFKSLCNRGENHIDGLGPSFFTKVLYFTSHIHGNTYFLILDGKMWSAYNAFRIANKLQKRRSVSNCTFEDYIQYCKYMHSFDRVNNPEELEAFLFTHNDKVKQFLTNTQNTNSSNGIKKERKPRKKTGKGTIKNNDILPLKNRKKGDVLIDGYGKIITLKEYPIRLFVAQRGQSFFCQLCYQYEEDIEKRSNFFMEIVADEILNKFSNENWKGGESKKAWKTYKSVMFEGSNAEQKAKNLYDRISSFVEKNNIQ